MHPQQKGVSTSSMTLPLLLYLKCQVTNCQVNFYTLRWRACYNIIRKLLLLLSSFEAVICGLLQLCWYRDFRPLPALSMGKFRNLLAFKPNSNKLVLPFFYWKCGSTTNVIKNHLFGPFHFSCRLLCKMWKSTSHLVGDRHLKSPEKYFLQIIRSSYLTF